MAEDDDNPSKFANAGDYYRSRHDWLSHRFSWNEQHLVERFGDLMGFMASISGALEGEKLDYQKYSFPLGFYEVEQPSRVRYIKVDLSLHDLRAADSGPLQDCRGS